MATQQVQLTVSLKRNCVCLPRWSCTKTIAGSRSQYGSLTLGGYDSSRIDSSATMNATTMPFDADNSRILSVPIQAMTGINTLESGVALINRPYVAVIDSTMPELWLPIDACSLFEKAFGLTFDVGTGLYLVNETIHNRLKQMSPSVTISLKLGNTSAETTEFSFSYGAFDLEASYPLYPSNESRRYFPIRRANDSFDYILGRVSLQEAYVIVDYERSTFSVHKALYQDCMPAQDLISILPVGEEKTAVERSSLKRLSMTTIVGIVVGSIVFCCMLVAVLVNIRRRRKSGTLTETQEDNSPNISNPGLEAGGASIQEMDHSQMVQETGGLAILAELDPRNMMSGAFELSSKSRWVETE
jgi:hypothetical protein